LIKPRHEQWNVPVITASALEKNRIKDIWTQIQNFKNTLSTRQIEANRRDQAKNWLWIEVQERLLMSLKDNEKLKNSVSLIQDRVENGEIAPSTAASQLVSQFLKTL